MSKREKAPVRVQLEGSFTPDSFAEIVTGKSIRICGSYTNHVKGPQAFDRTFNIGDDAVRSSFNLTYTGKVTAIGPKTVTVTGTYGDQVSRLTISLFAWRNWNYDAEQIAERNAAWCD